MEQAISIDDFIIKISFDINLLKKINVFSRFKKCEDIYNFIMYNTNILDQLEPHYISYRNNSDCVFIYDLVFKHEKHALLFVDRINKYIEDQEKLPVFLALKEPCNESYP